MAISGFLLSYLRKTPLIIFYEVIAEKAKIRGGKLRGGVCGVCLIFSGRGSSGVLRVTVF